MPTETALVLATTNAGKLREMKAFLGQYVPSVRLLGLDACSDLPAVAETGATFAANALLKGHTYARATGLPVLAEDAGLEVDALGGRPGVHSARYGATDAERIARLLAELQGVEPSRRTARFVSVIALVRPDGREHLVRGTVEGYIATGAHGQGGFGYDPVFALPDGRCLAALSTAEKNRLSHRGSALRQVVAILPDFLEG